MMLIFVACSSTAIWKHILLKSAKVFSDVKYPIFSLKDNFNISFFDFYRKAFKVVYFV